MKTKAILGEIIAIAAIVLTWSYYTNNVLAVNIAEENLVIGKNQTVKVIEGAVKTDYIILLNEDGSLPENITPFEGDKEIIMSETEETKSVYYMQLGQNEITKIGTPKGDVVKASENFDSISENAAEKNVSDIPLEVWTLQEIVQEHWNRPENRKHINVVCDATAPVIQEISFSQSSYKAEEFIQLTILYNEPLKNPPIVKSINQSVTVTEDTPKSFTATWVIPADYDINDVTVNGNISYEISAPEDNYGNIGIALSSGDAGAKSILFTGRKELNGEISATITGNKKKIKPGDSITILVTPTGAADIASKCELSDAQIGTKNANLKGMEFSYTFSEADIEKAEIPYCFALRETYQYDKAEKKIAGNLEIEFDKTKPKIISADIVQTGSIYLTDTLKVRFSTSEAIKTDTVKAIILGEKAEVIPEQKRDAKEHVYAAQINIQDTVFSKNNSLIEYEGSDKYILGEKINTAIIKIEDEAGNISETADGTSSLTTVGKDAALRLIGLTPPIRPTEIIMEKVSANSFTGVGAEEEIQVKVSAKYPFKILKEGSKLFKFSDNLYEELDKDIEAVESNGKYTASIIGSTKASVESQIIPFELNAQNIEATASKNILTIQEDAISTGINLTYDGIIPTIEEVIPFGNGEESNKDGTAYINDKGIIKIGFAVSEVNTTAEVEVAGNKFTLHKNETENEIQNWEASGTISTSALTEGDSIPYRICVTDKAGNEASAYTEATQDAQSIIYDITSPIIEEETIIIQNEAGENVENEKREYEGHYYIKPGDKAIITSKITDDATGHALRIPEILFLEELVEVTSSDLDANVQRWKSEYLISEINSKTDKAEGDLCVIRAKDCADNSAETAILNTQYIVDATNPKVTVNSFESNNTDKSKVKMGDTITVLFETDEAVRNIPDDNKPLVKLFVNSAAGGMIERTCEVEALTDETLPVKLANKWKATYKFTENDGETFAIKSDITCRIKVKDKAENENNNANQEIDEKLEWTAPIKASDITFESNNLVEGASAKQYLVEGKQAILQLTINNPEANLTIEGSIANSTQFKAVKEGARYTITSEPIAKGSINDSMSEKEVPFELDIMDETGNRLQLSNQNANGYKGNKLMYMAPLKAETNLTSTNRKDMKKFAKDGDTLEVEIKPNHKIEKIIEGKIAGLEAVLSNDKISYLIKPDTLKENQFMEYQITIQDEAMQIFKIEESSQMKYYEPIQVNNITVQSDNTETGYARNGQMVTVKSAYNHEAEIRKSFIMGKSASAGNKGKELTSTLRISERENYAEEGLVEFEILVEDEAGNELNISNTDLKNSKPLVYDRTAPDIRIEPIFNGFTKEDISMNYIISDDNLGTDVSIQVNGKERITEGEKREGAVNGTLSKKVILEGEGEFKIAASAEDKAGNTIQSLAANVIVDKTSPKLTTTKINMEKPQTYPKGFVISDYFDIEEEYLKDIICKITDGTGSYDWDIDEPIMEDGKKTIYLLASDMADNISSALSYDIFIDGTEPKPIVNEKLTKRSLRKGKNGDFVGAMTLNISLADVYVGDEEPDKFIELKLLKDDESVISDILQNNQEVQAEYNISVTEFGKYNLQLQAVDTVGNQTPVMLYKFELRDKTVWDKFYENKPFFFGSITAFICTFSMTVLGIQISIHRKRKQG